MAEDAGSIYSEIRVRLDKLGTDISQAEAQIKKMGSSLDAQTGKDSDKIEKNYTDAFKGINIGAAALAAGATAAFKGLVDTFAKTEQSLANVRAVTGASAAEFEQLRAAAVKAGDETRFSASEAADALYFLASGGLDASQSIAALDGVLLLAGATQSDLAFTAETVTAVLSQFSLEASSAADVSNVFAAAAANSQATMEKLAASLQMVGPIAGTLGISLEETTSSLEALYNAGFKGESAGTALRDILLDLSDSTGPAAAKLEALGINMDAVNPKTVGLTGAIGALGASGATTEQLMAALGKTSGAQLAVLLKTGEDGLRSMQDAITGTNEAARQYAVQNDTLAGSFDEFSSKAESAGNSLVSTLAPAMRGLLGVIGTLLGFFTGLPSALQGVAAGFLTLGGGVLAVNVALGVFGVTMGALLGPITLAAASIGAVAIGISAVVVESKKMEAQRIDQEFGAIATQAKAAGENISDIEFIAQGVERQIGLLSMNNLEKDAKTLKASVFELADQYGVSSDTVAKILVNSSKINAETRAIVDAQFKITENLNKQVAASTWDLQNRRGQAILDAKKIVDLGEQNKAIGNQAVLLNNIAGIDKLLASGTISEIEGLQKKIKARETIISQIQSEAEKTGILTGAQIAQLKAQESTIMGYEARLEELQAKKEIADMTDLERRTATLELISNEEIRVDEEYLVRLDTKIEALRNAGVSELEIEAYKAAQILAFENKKIADRNNTLLLLKTAEEQESIRQKTALDLQVEQLKAAGATELQIDKFVKDQKEKSDTAAAKKSQDAWIADFKAKTDLALQFAGLANSIFQQLTKNEIDEINARLKEQNKALDKEYESRLAAGEDKTELDKEFSDRKAKIEQDAAKESADLQYRAAVADWWIKQAQLAANAPLVVTTSVAQLGPIAGLIVGGGVIVAQEAALLAAYPKRPAFETGGIVIGGSGGTTVQVAENGSTELLFNDSAAGRPMMEAFADLIAERSGPKVIQLVVSDQVLAEVVVGKINNGNVRLER